MRCCAGPDGTRWWEGTRALWEGVGAGGSKGTEVDGNTGWWEALRNWVSEAISSPQAAALSLTAGCSGASPERLPRLGQKPWRPGLSRRVGTPLRCPSWAG